MPTATGPALLTVVTGGISGAYLAAPEHDVVTPGPAYALRAGITMRDAGLDLELVTGGQPGTTVEGYAFVASPTHVDALWRVYDGYRFAPYVGGGVGWRHLRFGQVTVSGRTADEAYGYDGTPVLEALATANAGARYHVAGPVHLRVDASAALVVSSATARPGLLLEPGLSVGLDLRWAPPPDRDRDGVPDSKDRCADSLEDWDYYEDNDGCLDPDDDGDGIPDRADECKSQAEDVDGFRDDDGCADSNNDRDAYPDALDSCPNEPETENNYHDGDGCPDTVPADVQALLGERRDINFDGRVVSASSNEYLEKVIAASLAHPDVVFQFKVYTDGADGATAAHARAATGCVALLHWFAARGLTWERFSFYVGGDRLPLGPDDSPEGIARNRRVVVELYEALDGDGKPIDFTPVPVEAW